jgi:hypothetical protein
MLCSRWFSLENLAYTAARISFLLHSLRAVFGKQIRKMLGKIEQLGRYQFKSLYLKLENHRAHMPYDSSQLSFRQGRFADFSSYFCNIYLNARFVG